MRTAIPLLLLGLLFPLPGRAEEPPPPGELTRAPSLKQPSDPAYPAAALERGLEGRVVLRVSIDARGRVTVVEPEEASDPVFLAPSLEAARFLRFVPAEIDGAPAPMTLLYTYEFRLGAAPPAAEEAVPVADASTASGGETVVRAIPPWESSERAPALPSVEARGTTFELTRRDLDFHPGTYGDLQRALHRLPGVAGDSGNLTGFHLRGGEEREAWVELDGLRVRKAGHLRGFTSLFDPDLVDGVTLHLGAPPASVRGGLSGALEVRYVDEPHDRFDGSVDLSFVQLSAKVAAALHRDKKVSTVVGARYSLLDVYLSAFGAADALPAEFDTLRYIDAFARVTARPTERDRLRVSGLFSTDRMKLDDVNERTVVGGVALDWARAAGAVDLEVGAAWSLNRDEEPDPGDFVYPFPKERRDEEQRVEARASVRHRASPRVTWSLGVDAAAVVLRGVGAFPNPEGLPTWAPLPFAEYALPTAQIDFRTTRPEVAGWVEVEARRLLGPLRVNAGLRVVAMGPGFAPDVEPRLAASLPMPTGTTLSGSVGAVTDLPSDPLLLHPLHGNPDLRPERALLSELTFGQRLPGEGFVRLTGFHKRYDRLIVSGEPATGLDAWGAARRRGEPRWTNEGTGWAAGLEVEARYRVGRFGAQASWTLLKTERTNPRAARFPRTLAPRGDQRHGVVLGVDLLVGRKRNLQLSLLYLYKSGWPLGTLAPVPADGAEPVRWTVREADGRRFADAHRLNFRLEHFIRFRAWRLRGSFELNTEPSGPGFVEDCSSVTDEDGVPPSCAPFGFLPPVRPWLGLKAEW